MQNQQKSLELATDRERFACFDPFLRRQAHLHKPVLFPIFWVKNVRKEFDFQKGGNGRLAF